MSALDHDAVRAAYRRWARIYDVSFGAISRPARRRAAAVINALPGRRVLEMGVGTGLALPLYAPDKRVTGIDLSAEMLDEARRRTSRLNLAAVEALLERDAQNTGLPDASFDIAAAMFVASVVPDARQLLAEMRRLVRPGGHLLFINHFSAEGGPRLAVERALSPFARALGWHPDFPIERLLPPEMIAAAQRVPMPPGGLFTLVKLASE